MPYDIDSKRARILGLAIDCPMGRPSPGCHLEPIRHMTLADAQALLKELSESDVEQILQCHQHCLAERKYKETPEPLE